MTIIRFLVANLGFILISNHTSNIKSKQYQFEFFCDKIFMLCYNNGYFIKILIKN